LLDYPFILGEKMEDYEQIEQGSQLKKVSLVLFSWSGHFQLLWFSLGYPGRILARFSYLFTSW